MSMLPPVGWADVATKSDLHALEVKLDGRIDRLDGRLDAMTADLRAELHQSIRNQTWALVAWTTALAGLIVGLLAVTG